jgi:transketolase
MNLTDDDQRAINTIRVLAADMVFKSQSGHPGNQSSGSSYGIRFDQPVE